MRKNTKPQLRFPLYDSNWTIRKLKDVAPLQRGFDLPTTNVIEGKYPVVYSNGIGRYHNEFKAKAPGIVTGRSGTIGALTYVENDYWPHNTSLWVTDFIDCTPKFVFYLYQKIGLKRFATGSGVPTLNRNDVHDFRANIPELNEQQKIADFLTSVDTKISQLTEKHRLLKAYKKGVIQQIFSQQIRFKDEDGKAFPDWKTEAIGKYLEPYKELVPASTDLPILTSSRTGLYLQERSVINDGDYGVVPLGYFTYRHMSDDLIFKFNVNRDYTRGAISKEYPVFKTVGMDTYFLETKLNEGHEFKRFAIQQKQGGTRTRLYFKNLKELKLALPCLAEQQKIAQFLQSIDQKIDAVAEQIEQTKQFKKGLLQQMFV
ncbi:restriction endonuclease subunit S [Vibrio sp. Hep-1b-8]|uniref:restriction endonuclease subunit S n=1 Tax=Vibrio sp. Hep-1b-8 TaxID=2144187 RepID=UPI001110631E|nr:restriction endonuclease subunit S [Vibrio sp. Hep-1b-8]TMX34389.1 hypothetical protein DA100_15905 [Vibrio sp. Hep-1b-8]